MAEFVPSGEMVMFKVPKTGDPVGSFKDRWEEGVWMGCNVRDGMAIIGTIAGVFKAGTFRRKLEGENWSADMIKGIAGTPQKPDPTTEHRRVTTFTKSKMEGVSRASVRYRPPVNPTPETRRNEA